jgi:hypothetical protein
MGGAVCLVSPEPKLGDGVGRMLLCHQEGFPSIPPQRSSCYNPNAANDWALRWDRLAVTPFLSLMTSLLSPRGASEALSDAGADVVTAHDLRTALEAAMSGNVSAAILDVTLGALTAARFVAPSTQDTSRSCS